MKVEKFNTLLVDDLGEVVPLAIAVVPSFYMEEAVVIITNAVTGHKTVTSCVEGISYKINFWRNDRDMRNFIKSEVLTPMVNGIPERFFSVDMCNASILAILNSNTDNEAKILNCIQQDLKNKFPYPTGGNSYE